jgi:hypothetical protein
MKTVYENQTTEVINPIKPITFGGCFPEGCYGKDEQGRTTLNGKLYQPNVNTNEVTCNDGTKDITNGKKPPCINNGGVKQISPVKLPLSVTNPELYKKNIEMSAEKDKKMRQIGVITLLAKASIVPIGFYAFSKYQKYDNKKTAKVTIIGSVVVLGLVVLNGFSGAFSGTTFIERTFGNKKEKLVPKLIK